MLIKGSGERYIGTFFKGKLNGPRIKIYFNDSRLGIKFEGEFKDGLPHGMGISYKPDGSGAEFEEHNENGSVKIKKEVTDESYARLSGYVSSGSASAARRREESVTFKIGPPTA